MEKWAQSSTTKTERLEVLIPSVGLRALKHVQYKTQVSQILEANPGIELPLSEMQLLWNAIVHKAFCFVCACERERKAMEVCGCFLKMLIRRVID